MTLRVINGRKNFRERRGMRMKNQIFGLSIFILGVASQFSAVSEAKGRVVLNPKFPSPTLNIVDSASSDFDQWWCRGSMVPIQDPIFTEIRRDRFQIDPKTDRVTLPQAWFDESKLRVPQLRKAALDRVPTLLSKASELVGRAFRQKNFDYFFYLCPFWDGGTAAAKTFPMFQYLESAVGKAQQWPDWLLTDQYLFHEILHNYVMEKVDYTKGTPVLNALYSTLLTDAKFEADSKAYLRYPSPVTPDYAARWVATDQAQMIGTVLTHIHVYGIMTQTLKAIGDQTTLDTIRAFETGTAASHPSYVWAWKYIEAIEGNPGYMKALLNEVK
jgi:hypothetical protein